MATDLTLVCPGERGTIARAFEALGEAGVEVAGYAAFQRTLHVLVDDAGPAREAVERAGIEVGGEEDVLVATVDTGPAGLGELLRRIADSGVDLHLIYTTNDGRAVIGVSDRDRARRAGFEAVDFHG